MNLAQERILVTGASGFIGANLCHRLVTEGFPVAALLNPNTRTWRLDGIQSQLQTFEVDLCDEPSVHQAIHTIRPTIIYHLAAHGAYPFQNDCAQILRTNVFGLWNLLSACKNVGFHLFINAGSSSEYGRKSFAMRETDPLDPDSFYAIAKAAQSFLCRHAALLEKLPVVTLRLFSVYGPFEEPSRLIPTLMMASLFDTRVKMVSADVCRDFIHVDDVIDFMIAAPSFPGLSGEILNLGTGRQTSMGELVSTLEEVSGRRLPVTWGAMPERSWDSTTWVADISKLRALTGFVPSRSVKDGLRECLTWFEANSHLYGEPGILKC